MVASRAHADGDRHPRPPRRRDAGVARCGRRAAAHGHRQGHLRDPPRPPGAPRRPLPPLRGPLLRGERGAQPARRVRLRPAQAEGGRPLHGRRVRPGRRARHPPLGALRDGRRGQAPVRQEAPRRRLARARQERHPHAAAALRLPAAALGARLRGRRVAREPHRRRRGSGRPAPAEHRRPEQPEARRRARARAPVVARAAAGPRRGRSVDLRRAGADPERGDRPRLLQLGAARPAAAVAPGRRVGAHERPAPRHRGDDVAPSGREGARRARRRRRAARGAPRHRHRVDRGRDAPLRHHLAREPRARGGRRGGPRHRASDHDGGQARRGAELGAPQGDARRGAGDPRRPAPRRCPRGRASSRSRRRSSSRSSTRWSSRPRAS